ncbi:T9SS type A sorting domain-containing protein [Adhaeribacter sp. BT258]|uniref:T9SS type A sorting domain-containing protein n=1 Tax=Adhaeribacter terrigena TaxID=2793070 RepID=A0ABS1BX57_9BACT|nr:T9SS type A sorting domain-containing protein [Adhaeribacter terrigena]MBK0401639.1 T9SS type A sorting domain-containing protein [Adhaeribacter terrigena]
MKKILLLLLFVAGFSRISAAQSVVFAFDSIWAPPYICQASHFDVEVFGTVADGSIQYGTQSFSVRNDTILVQFYFVAGPGPAMPYPLYRKINVPAPWTFGPYKIVAQGIYNGQVHQTINSRISICSGVSGLPKTDKKAMKIKLYPNPAQDFISFEATGITGSAAVATIKDLTGKTCLTEKTETSQKNRFSVAALPAGIYVLQLQTEKGVVSQKFIKQ